MPDDASLTLDLSPEHAEAVRSAVAAGDYETERAALAAAVEAWRRDRAKEALLERMKQTREAIARGEGRTVEQVFDRLLARGEERLRRSSAE